MKVVVDRKRWLRGKLMGIKRVKNLTSYLYDSDSKCMCCLGFASRAGGLDLRRIKDIGTPAGVVKDSAYPTRSVKSIPKVLLKLLTIRKFRDGGVNTVDDSLICSKLMSINDEEDITETEREEKLVREGKKAGLQFTFIN